MPDDPPAVDPDAGTPRPAPATAAARTGRGQRSPGVEPPGAEGAVPTPDAGHGEPPDAPPERPAGGPVQPDDEKAVDAAPAERVDAPAEQPDDAVLTEPGGSDAGTAEDGDAREDPPPAEGPTEIAVTSRRRAWWGMAAIVLREWAIVIGLLGLGAAIASFGERVVAGGLTPGELLTLLLAPLAYALLLAIQGGVLVAALVVAVLAPAGLRLARPAFVGAAVAAWLVGATVALALFGFATLPLLAVGVAALLHLGTLLWRFRRQDRAAVPAAGEG